MNRQDSYSTSFANTKYSNFYMNNTNTNLYEKFTKPVKNNFNPKLGFKSEIFRG